MTTTFKELYQHLIEEYREGRLKLPSLPEVALRIREQFADESLGVQQLAKVIESDPALAARLIQVANSPAYRGVVPVSSCLTAISRLGLVASRNLALALALRSRFDSKNPQLKRLMRQLWSQSCRVGVIAQMLSAFAPGLRPDQALLAGLTHNIGMLPLVAYLERFPELMADEEALWSGLYQLQGKIGSELLRQWQFDEALAAIPMHCCDWFYEGQGRNPDYIELILMAQIHNHFIGKLPLMASPPALDAIPAFHKFSLAEAGPEASLRMIEKAQQELEEMVEVLQ